MRVLRVYHAGRDRAHRERDRALVAAGAEVVLAVPRSWPDSGSEPSLSTEPFEVVELAVRRAGDVNRYALADPDELHRLVMRVRPDLVDLHAEPVSTLAHQAHGVLAPQVPVVGYTAQNLDKRFPPPFAQHERASYRRWHGLYPCSRQAASVAVGKGFAGLVQVLPLGWSPVLRPGTQDSSAAELQLLLLGRLLPEKGVLDAVRVLDRVHRSRPARLVLVGTGPEAGAAQDLARELGLADRLELRPWLAPEALADLYAGAHAVLVPSLRTPRWVEQFGRVVVEAQAAGAVVASYATGSLPEVVGEAGLLAAEGDHAALADGLLAALAEPGRWTALRAQGLAAAEQRSWTRIGADQMAFYERAVDAGPPPAPRPASSASRAAARAAYGPPAQVQGGGRPYALPVLRGGGAWARGLGQVQDGLSVVARGAAQSARRSTSA